MNIKKIAQAAGVSSATVSRVLNDSGYVKEETRQKVMKVMDEFNYVPSDIARSLSNQDSKSIGVIVPDIENDFFSKVISGISEVAEQRGYTIVFMNTDETLEKEHVTLNLVKNKRLKGIIITPVSQNDTVTRDKLNEIRESGIPVVLVDRDVKDSQFDGSFVDNEAGSYEGVKELIKCGHTRIATIKGPDYSRPGRDRYKGYKRALEEAGIEIRKDYIALGNFRMDRAYECMDELMKLEEPPTAVFTSNNLTTLGCLKYCTAKGYKVGEDISIMSFDDNDVLKIINYNISVIDRDAKEQGRRAMQILEQKFEVLAKGAEKEEQETVRYMIPYQVILRGSEKYNFK